MQYYCTLMFVKLNRLRLTIVSDDNCTAFVVSKADKLRKPDTILQCKNTSKGSDPLTAVLGLTLIDVIPVKKLIMRASMNSRCVVPQSQFPMVTAFYIQHIGHRV